MRSKYGGKYKTQRRPSVNGVHVTHSVVSNSLQSHELKPQAPLSMDFSRQEYWSGLPCTSPGDLPDPGTEPGSPTLKADSLLSELPGASLKAPIYN